MSTLPTALLMAQHHSFFVFFGFMCPMKLAAINAIKVYQDEIAKAGDLRENKIIVVRILILMNLSALNLSDK